MTASLMPQEGVLSYPTGLLHENLTRYLQKVLIVYLLCAGCCGWEYCGVRESKASVLMEFRFWLWETVNKPASKYTSKII